MSPKKIDVVPSKIELLIDSMVRGKKEEIDAYLTRIDVDVKVLETKSNVHFYVVTHDGNERPRVKDLAKTVAAKVVEYAIPRSEIIKAKEYLLEYNSPAKFSELHTKAKKLFTNLEKTGEGGEMLLYILAQYYLKLPQVLCKMSLKTNSRLHYNGADALHMTFDKALGKLALYWGEAKLFQSVSTAITDCLDSIKPFLCDDGGTDSRQSRDLQLLSSYLDLGDEEMEEALLRFLDPDDPMFNKLQYRGVCLIGFDEAKYPSDINSKTHEDVVNEIEGAIEKWKQQLSRKLLDRSPLHEFHLEIFMLPLPSVDEFRESFLGEIHS